MFVARGVRQLAETNLECYFLAGIIVEIKTEGVKTSLPEKYRGRAGIWIDGQSHRYCPGVPRKR